MARSSPSPTAASSSPPNVTVNGLTPPIDAKPLSATTKQPERPPLRQNFALEPNPFEVSFYASQSSTSLPTTKKTAGKKSDAGSDDEKPTLPPVAALDNPHDGGMSWAMSASDLTNSLRAGPLSPAMLQGPAASSANSTFDPAHPFRTGLTPGSGLTPLVGGPVSFPPPSPNTAAFLAMVTHQAASNNLGPPGATITPNTLSALSGVLNGTHNPPPPSHQQQPQAPQPPQPMAHNGPQGPAYAPNGVSHRGEPPSYAASAATAANSAANGLFLLSQAHQELTKREEAQRATQVPNGKSRSSKRNKSPPPPANPPAAKRTRARRANTINTQMSIDDEDMDDDDDDDDDIMGEDGRLGSPPSPTSANPGGKPKSSLTEEEKRRNFLERNRQAALKCRQRKKAWLTQLQAKVEFLTNENERLTSALVNSREEIARLSQLLGGQPHGQHGQHNGVGVGAPVSVPVNIASQGRAGSPTGPPPQKVAAGRGYGY